MNICVFCSSSNALDEVFYEQARELGRAMVLRGHSLVYGGANVGLMHALAAEVVAGGGRVTGVIPERIRDRGLAFNRSDRMIVTPDLRERKKTMEHLSDAFMALPGGFGTLEEVLEILTLKQLQYHNKPIVFLNTDGYFDGLTSFFDTLFSRRFAKEEYRRYFYVVDQVGEALNSLETHQEQPFTDKWYNVEKEEFL